jgi:hypothetical protein
VSTDNDNDNLEPIPSNLEFYGKAARAYKSQADACATMADTLRMFAGSIGANISAKANEYEYKPSKYGNKIAKSYNLMRVMQGLKPITTWDDVQGPTEGLRYLSGTSASSQSEHDKAKSEKVRKSFELMRSMGGGR